MSEFPGSSPCVADSKRDAELSLLKTVQWRATASSAPLVCLETGSPLRTSKGVGQVSLMDRSQPDTQMFERALTKRLCDWQIDLRVP